MGGLFFLVGGGAEEELEEVRRMSSSKNSLITRGLDYNYENLVIVVMRCVNMYIRFF